VKKYKLILRYGTALIRLCPANVLGYLLSSFLSQTAIPLTIAVLLGWLTDAIQPERQNSGIHHLELLPSFGFWLLLTFGLIPARILFRSAQTSMDNQMEKHVRENLFDKVIRQTPEFFHRYNPGQLANILTQTSIEAQQALRAIVVDPFLQIVSLCSATTLIIVQLRQNHERNVWWLFSLAFYQFRWFRRGGKNPSTKTNGVFRNSDLRSLA
jgi:ABC-type multidrug transport system fused ATPase/permease subunit